MGVTSEMACAEAQRNEGALYVWRTTTLSMSRFGGVAGDKLYGVVRGQVTKDSVYHTKDLLVLSCRQFNENLMREMT